MRSSSKRGGSRVGAGRPPLSPEQVQTHVSIRLTPAQIEQLKRIGNGNASEGARRLLVRRDALLLTLRNNLAWVTNMLDAAKELDAPSEVLAPIEDEVLRRRTELNEKAAEYLWLDNLDTMEV